MKPDVFDGAQTIGWARFISTVGVTSIVTLAGGYWLATYVVSNQLRIIDKLDVLINQNIIIADQVTDRAQETRRNDAEFMYYARVVCNTLTEMQGLKTNICINPRAFYPEASPEPQMQKRTP